jgi:hypothetical protein
MYFPFSICRSSGCSATEFASASRNACLAAEGMLSGTSSPSAAQGARRVSARRSLLTAGLQSAATDASSRFRRGQNADRLRRLRELHDWRTTADRAPRVSSSTTR